MPWPAQVPSRPGRAPAIRMALLASLALLGASQGAAGCSSCSGDPSGDPGVVIDYGEVVHNSAATGPVHAKACFGQVCREADSNGPLGARLLVPLANEASPAAPVSLKVTTVGGAVLYNAQEEFAVPAIHNGEGCGADLWSLSVIVRDNKLQTTSPIKLTPSSA